MLYNNLNENKNKKGKNIAVVKKQTSNNVLCTETKPENKMDLICEAVTFLKHQMAV